LRPQASIHSGVCPITPIDELGGSLEVSYKTVLISARWR
jgi:hypothetical protein